MASRLLDRLFGRPEESSPVSIEPKRLLPVVAEETALETKASSLALLPSGAYGQSYTFFSPDGGRTMLDLSDGPATIAFIAYWYVATRWRAQKIAEPPLMVVHEDQKTGAEEWLNDHELNAILEEPTPDYDMGELLECTSLYLDNTGGALWVKDVDNVGRVARLTPFSRNEFEIVRTADRLFGAFRVQTSDGPQTFTADQCLFFRDSSGSTAWGRGRSRLDVALSWLKLGAKAQQIVYDLLTNAVWPSGVITTDKDWDPSEKLYEEFRQDVQKYAKAGNKGKPFIALGGGDFKLLQSTIKDLVPTDILNRVESVVSAVSGVPAIVLQFQIGMENSPWSQMEEARKMAYADTIVPAWRKIERVATKQLLRPIDEDTTHFVRFDSSQVAALQQDQLEQVQIATLMGKAASLNERRFIMGLEPSDDPKAEEIPELTQPTMESLLAAGAKDPTDAPPKEDAPKKPDDTKDPAKKIEAIHISMGITEHVLRRKMRLTAIQDAFRDEAIPIYTVHAQHQLTQDSNRIADIVLHMLLDVGEGKAIESKARGKETVLKAVARYLGEDGRKGWTRAIQPLNERAVARSGAAVAADLNLNFSLLHGNLLTYARKQTGKMITDVNRTTQSLVSDIIQGGIDAQQSTRSIARVISEATGFSRSRAELIARTETTKAFNGAPTESLSVLAQSSDRTFTKTWSGVLDDKERDEHLDLEGETVGIDEEFSNGLQYPSEPNCRCTMLFEETTQV